MSTPQIQESLGFFAKVADTYASKLDEIARPGFIQHAQKHFQVLADAVGVQTQAAPAPTPAPEEPAAPTA